MSGTVASLSVTDILKIASISGAFGGIVFECIKITIRGSKILYSEEPAYFRPFALIILISAIAGAGSGIGLLFALYFLKLLKEDATVGNELFLISACLIAGMAAKRLIPSYTRALENRIENVAKGAEETRKVAEEAAILTKVQANLAPDATRTQKLEAIEDIRSQLQRYPLDRRLNIFLGRLLRQLGDFQGAIRALQDFLKRKEQAKNIDKDYSDALYNIACYYALEWEGKRNQPAKEGALEALKRSIEISSENKRDAREDIDFRSLRDDPQFIEITKD